MPKRKPKKLTSARKRTESTAELLEARPLIEALNRDFGNLREVLQSQDEALTAALVEPALNRFCETLDTVAASRDDLAEKCHDLQHHLRRFLEPHVDAPRSFDSFDEELPF